MRAVLVFDADCRTPQGVRGLKQPPAPPDTKESSRTPQGVRGLKPRRAIDCLDEVTSHSARSAWIETGQKKCGIVNTAVALRKECVD